MLLLGDLRMFVSRAEILPRFSNDKTNVVSLAFGANVYFNEYEIHFDAVLFCMLSTNKYVNPKRNIA